VTTASGATGKLHDWKISCELASFSSRPFILAGGLTAENVDDGIATVRPFGVDAHTGVEDKSGRKNRDKVRAFVASARKAFSAL
jgi:phosphoribosylanthranilate isomerase